MDAQYELSILMHGTVKHVLPVQHSSAKHWLACALVVWASGFVHVHGGLLEPGESTDLMESAIYRSTFLQVDSQPFHVGDLTGWLTTEVYANDGYNSLGGLTFAYSIMITQTGYYGPKPPPPVVVSGFENVQTDVAWAFMYGGTFVPNNTWHPTTATRSLDGSTITFTPYDPPTRINSGGVDYTGSLLVRTDATEFVPSTLSVVGSAEGFLRTFVPRPVVEDNSTFALLMLTLGGVIALGFWRRCDPEHGLIPT